MKVKIKFLTNLKKTILSALLILGVTSGAGLFAAASKSNTVKKVVALSKSVAEMWLLVGGEISATTDDGLELEGA